MYWMHEVCCLGPGLAGRVPPASLGQVPAVGWRASLVHYRQGMAELAGECRGRLVIGAHLGTMMANGAAAPVGTVPKSPVYPHPIRKQKGCVSEVRVTKALSHWSPVFLKKKTNTR